jgi:GntR family transcriptional regulator
MWGSALTGRKNVATMNLASRSPLYAQLGDTIRERIKSGVYAANSAIPSQAEFAEEFGVSHITIRRALRELTFEGLIYSRQGLGVFVADRQRIVRSVLTGPFASISENIARSGLTPSVKEISFGRCAPDLEVSRRLELPPKAVLYRHEKVIFADGAPLAIDVIHLPSRLALQLGKDLADNFMFRLLSRHGIKIGSVKREFHASLALAREAELLGSVPPLSLIVSRYDVFDREGAPLLSGQTFGRADRMRFEISTEA